MRQPAVPIDYDGTWEIYPAFRFNAESDLLEGFGRRPDYLSPRRWKCLQYLIDSTNGNRRWVSYQELLENVWRKKYAATDPDNARQKIRAVLRFLKEILGEDVIRIDSGKGCYFNKDFEPSPPKKKHTYASPDGIYSGMEPLEALRKPTKDAISFAEHFGALNKLPIGDVIELYPHPLLHIRSAFVSGWDTANITLNPTKTAFNPSQMLEDPDVKGKFYAAEESSIAITGKSLLRRPNGHKYMISGVQPPFSDDDVLDVSLTRTRYFDMLRARPAVENLPEIRRRYGHSDPSQSRIPQAVGIQFTVVFKDHAIMAMERAKNTFTFAGKWSFSGEEQLAPIDITWDNKQRMDRLLLRALIEETFPLARKHSQDLLREVMNLAERYIGNRKVWSIALEEKSSTLQLFAVIELRLTVQEYQQTCVEMLRQGLGQFSQEGRYYSMALNSIHPLLAGRTVTIRPLWGGENISLTENDLHPTSRYRLWRILADRKAFGF